MKNSTRALWILSICVLSACVLSACVKTEQPPAPVSARAIPEMTESPSSPAESVISQIGHYASVSEGRMASVKSAAVNVSASVSGVCDGSLIRPLKCTGGVISTVWNGCLDRNSLIATGGVTDRFTVDATAAGDDDACNASLHPPGLTQDGVSMVRQIPMMSYDFGVAWKGNPLQGGKLVIDTAPPPAWDGTTFDPKGTVVSRQGLKRKIKINGLHEHLTSFSGKVIYDYSHSGEIIMTGALATADRSIDSGSQLVTWNNSSSTKIIHTFANDLAGNPVRWASTRCCFPVQGQVTSVYSGQVSGTTVMTFTGCAKANFVGLDGVKTPVSLSRCL